MGVTGLLSLFGSIQESTHVRNFHGKTLAVDGYGWLHRGAVSCAIELAQGKPTQKYVDYFMHRVRLLIYHGVKPYIVFDGDRLPSKAGVEKSRRESRKEKKTRGLELLKNGRIKEAQRELQGAVDITPLMARYVIEELKAIDVPYVVAPYEADSQMVYLEKTGIVDAILSEDSDLLVFGANCLLTKLEQFGECVMIRKDDFTSCKEVNLTGWTNSELRRMAIMSGCDYLPGIRQMGLKTAHKLVRKYKTIERIIRQLQMEGKRHIPMDYLEQFKQADMTFLYQWVFCPRAQRMVNLTIPDSATKLDGITYIGKELDPGIARGVALGDLHPMTKLPIVFRDENRRDVRTPAERRASLKTADGVVSSSKKTHLEKFLKPRRTPLAELDINLFKPTESQQRLLDQPQREWLPDQAPIRPSTTDEVFRPPSARPPLPNAQSAPNSTSKRKRLCAEDELCNSITPLAKGATRSKFFDSSAKASSRKRSSRPGFELWSDDSAIGMMETLPMEVLSAGKSNTIEQTSRNTPTGVNLLAKKSKIQVFSALGLEAVAMEKADTTLPTEDSTSTKKGQQRLPFTSGLQLEAGALNARSSINPPQSATGPHKQSRTSVRSSAIATAFNKATAVQKPADITYIEHIEQTTSVKESPPTQSSQRLIEASPLRTPIRLSKQKRRGAGALQSSVIRSLPSNRGSEDMIVPDSDAPSEMSEGFVTSSSPLQETPKQDSELTTATRPPLRRGALFSTATSLKQFAFDADTPFLA